MAIIKQSKMFKTDLGPWDPHVAVKVNGEAVIDTQL